MYMYHDDMYMYHDVPIVYTVIDPFCISASVPPTKRPNILYIHIYISEQMLLSRSYVRLQSTVSSILYVGMMYILSILPVSLLFACMNDLPPTKSYYPIDTVNDITSLLQRPYGPLNYIVVGPAVLSIPSTNCILLVYQRLYLNTISFNWAQLSVDVSY